MAGKCMETLFSSIFDYQSPWLIKYYCLCVADTCNVDKFATFSEDVCLDLEMVKSTKSGKLIPASLCEIFKDMIAELIIAKGAYQSSENMKITVRCLESFIGNAGHFNCIKELFKRKETTKELSEAEIQSVLAIHLFSPLLAEGQVIVDQSCFKNKTKPQCPFCGSKKLEIGITNFGCKKFWHGRADIVIKGKHIRRVVTVATDEQDGERGEPACKKARLENQHYNIEEAVLNTVVKEKTSLGKQLQISVDDSNEKVILTKEKFVTQAICQTIVNAFLAVKESKTKIENYFIPSFLVSDEEIFINFYNVKEDILLSQLDPLPLFNPIENCMNYPTILAVWFALNFDRFLDSCALEDDDYYNNIFCKSQFRDHLKEKGVLKDYEDNVESEFVSAEKPKGKELMLGVQNDDFLPRLIKLVTELKDKFVEK